MKYYDALHSPWTLGALFLIAAVAILTPGAAAAADDIADHPACAYCGMDRGKFAHSRMLIRYDDGSSFGACSIHCAAVDMAVNIDKAPVNIQVADFNSKQLLDAEAAFWVVGGSKPGVMTRRAKWAFAEKAAAEAFVRENGGKVADFEEALEASYQDMYQDTRMIREKRKMKRDKMKPHS
jgi:nitrous oxide reductase accessory protein NosL